LYGIGVDDYFYNFVSYTMTFRLIGGREAITNCKMNIFEDTNEIIGSRK
jgi:hypothetical protein